VYRQQEESAADKDFAATCWESVTEIGNVWTLCLSDSKVKTNIFYKNANTGHPPTMCRARGTVSKSSVKWIININEGQCDNGRTFGGEVECMEPDNSVMTCLTRKPNRRFVFKQLLHVKDI
jgi:hypothetical protein